MRIINILYLFTIKKEVYMALRFVKVKRRIVVGATPGIKFLARMVQGNVIDMKGLAERISKTSSLSRGDIYSVLIQLGDAMTMELLEGNQVQVGEIGKFVPKFSAKAVNTLEEVDASTIKRVFADFSPSVEFRKKMDELKVKFEPLGDIKGLQIETEEPNP
jgi:predicted histone-like DNA-binding protein